MAERWHTYPAPEGAKRPRTISTPRCLFCPAGGISNSVQGHRATSWIMARRRLILPAVLAPAVETAVLLAWGPAGSAALGPQITAPPPFDLFHDLRWISVYHDSWVVLALELVAVDRKSVV